MVSSCSGSTCSLPTACARGIPGSSIAVMLYFDVTLAAGGRQKPPVRVPAFLP